MIILPLFSCVRTTEQTAMVRKAVLSILINLVFLKQLCLVDNYTKINPIQFRYKNNFFLIL